MAAAGYSLRYETDPQVQPANTWGCPDDGTLSQDEVGQS